MSYQWFRMWVDAVDDEKLKLLAFEDRWHFVAICCCKRKGILDEPDDAAMRDRKVGAKLGLADRERDEVRRRLVEVRLIDENWQPLAWNKRQFVSDSDPTATDRKRKQRDRQRHGKVTRDNRDSHAPVTDVSLEGHAPQTQITDSEKIKIGQTPSAFDRFWEVYPKRVKRKPAEGIWKRKHLDPYVDLLVSDVTRRKTSDQRWIEGYVPDPTTYLNQERWNDELQKSKSQHEEPRRGLPVLRV